jgi:class 3 adenylate cyclase
LIARKYWPHSRILAHAFAQLYAEGFHTLFRIRIGINTGVASVGDFGSEGRTT